MSKSVYNDFLAEIYDFSPYFGKGREEAISCYLDVIKNNSIKKVLELGTATGTLTCAMVEIGVQVDTIDISEAMQRIAKQKINSFNKFNANRVNFILADINFCSPIVKYDAIIIPDSLLFLAEIDKKRVLEMCYNSLKEKGSIIFDVFKKNNKLENRQKNKEIMRFRDKDNNVYIMETHHDICLNQKTHTCSFTYYKYPCNPNVVKIDFNVTYKYLFQLEIMSFLEDIGFINVNIKEIFNNYQLFISAKK